MKNYWPVFLLFLMSSCSAFMECVDGEGEAVSWDTTTQAIHSIENEISADIFYEYDPRLKETTIRIEGEQNLLDLIQVEVKRAALELESDYCLNSKKGIKIYISSPELRSVKMEGSGHFESDKLIQAKKLHMEINGSGNIDLSVEAQELSSVIYGSGDVKLSGQTEYLEAKIIGSGDIDADAIEAEMVYAKINGSGNARLWCTEDLEIKISGSGDVYYKGEPSELIQKIKGSGKVEKL